MNHPKKYLIVAGIGAAMVAVGLGLFTKSTKKEKAKTTFFVRQVIG